jgi:large repetitive protein
VGALPPGVNLAGNGLIAGTPTTNGSFSFIVTATDANGFTGNQSYTINIGQALTLAPLSLPNASVNAPYSQTLSATGGIAPYTFTIINGSVLGLNASTGVISGTPTNAGTFTFTVSANDSTAPTPLTGTRIYTIIVEASAPVYNSTPAPSTTINMATVLGTDVDYTIVASNGGTAALTVSPPVVRPYETGMW